jgi:sigma-B regulation protein RsbU (phosphoserine phosphatase)
VTIPDITPIEADRFALLARISQTFNSSLDLDQVLNIVMDEVITATHAERGFLMLGNTSDNLVFRAARGLDQHSIDDPKTQVSRRVIERVIREERPLLTSNAQDDARLSKSDSIMVLGLRSVLCVPLLLKGVILGIIYVDNRIQTGIFTPDHLNLLNSIAANAAIAIENARLYQVAVEKGRMERELQLAREVQTRLLPRNLPHMDGWDFAALWQPARETAGDFYDFIFMGQQQLGVVIADVSDKGMPAALYMALARSIVRSCVLSTASPVEAITQANQLICTDSTYGTFVTLFFAQINPITNEMIYVNAGHNPPFYFCAAPDELIRLTRTGIALGFDETAKYTQQRIVLQPGDFILFYTDGITEAIDDQEQDFGEERLQAVLFDQRHSSAARICQVLEKSIQSFIGTNAPLDDITIVIVKRDQIPE